MLETPANMEEPCAEKKQPGDDVHGQRDIGQWRTLASDIRHDKLVEKH